MCVAMETLNIHHPIQIGNGGITSGPDRRRRMDVTDPMYHTCHSHIGRIDRQ